MLNVTGVYGFSIVPSSSDGVQTKAYVSSKSCIQCHEQFYKLWSVSNHGLAMQPYTFKFSDQNLVSQKEAISIKGSYYKAETGSDQGWVFESSAVVAIDTSSELMLWNKIEDLRKNCSFVVH